MKWCAESKLDVLKYRSTQPPLSDQDFFNDLFAEFDDLKGLLDELKESEIQQRAMFLSQSPRATVSEEERISLEHEPVPTDVHSQLVVYNTIDTINVGNVVYITYKIDSTTKVAVVVTHLERRALQELV